MAQIDNDISLALAGVGDVREKGLPILRDFLPSIADGVGLALFLVYEGLVAVRAARARGEAVAEEEVARLRAIAIEAIQTLAAAKFGAQEDGGQP